jgi:hypothetical protein
VPSEEFSTPPFTSRSFLGETKLARENERGHWFKQYEKAGFVDINIQAGPKVFDKFKVQ